MQTRWIQTGLALVLGTAVGASGATITVNAVEDSLATDGNCTLREAILAANSDSAVDACAAGSGPDVVIVPAGRYQLTGEAGEDAALTGDLDITDDLELVGAGAASTSILAPVRVQAPPCSSWGCFLVQSDRSFDVDPGGTGISVRLSGVALLKAPFVIGAIDEGGAIRNRGTLVVADSMVRGSATRGGGILSLGPLRVERSEIGANSGAGISALGPLEVVESTISNHPATLAGDGISAAGPVALVNTTVSGNTGGGIVAEGLVELSNATVTDNGGGGVTAGSIVLRNTIIAGNAPVDCVAGSTTGDAYNIDGDGSCGLSGTDQPGIVDPRLGPLADNGGPTFTHALLNGSRAIDAGSPAAPGSGGTACESTDQRGVPRPVGSRCDVGAFEATDAITCPFPPRPACQAALGERSRLTLKQVANDRSKDRLSWSWVGSAPVAIDDFADPVAGSGIYAFCLYDRDGLRRQAVALAGGICGKRPCWKATSSGFAYSDPLLGPDGIGTITLTAGVLPGRARIAVKGKGINLGPPVLPLATPSVRVQLINNGGPSCWEASFSTTTRNSSEGFRARSDP